MFFVFFTFFTFPLSKRTGSSIIIAFAKVLLTGDYSVAAKDGSRSMGVNACSTGRFLGMNSISPDRAFAVGMRKYPATGDAICDSNIDTGIQFANSTSTVGDTLLHLSTNTSDTAKLKVRVLSGGSITVTVGNRSNFHSLILGRGNSTGLAFGLHCGSARRGMRTKRTGTLLCFSVSCR